MLQESLYIAGGGALGSVLRYWIMIWHSPISRQLPWSTILINVTGSFIIALFAAITTAQGRYALPEQWRIAFMVGVCGGFTTFSSFSEQTLELIRAGHPSRALLNVAFSVALCLAAAGAGYMVADQTNRGWRGKAITIRQ